MMQKFMDKGYEIVDFDEKADIYIINTCTVTNMSDRKSRQMLRQAKKINKDALVVACGCYAQVAQEEVKAIKEIDLVLGTNEKKDIVSYLEDYLDNKKIDGNYENKIVAENSITDDVMKNLIYDDFGDVTFTEKTRAVIKVQDGCDRYCTYCLIPYARGRIRSRKPESVISEVTKIAQNGIKEVVITGIHVASYGRDFESKYELIDLLEEINKVPGIERVRLGSIEPLLISEEFMERFFKLDKMCHHFHLSLQSGCDETLKRMNRRYSCAEFKEIVDRIRKYFVDSILTTDVIVGFPGETDEEFNKTVEFLRNIKFYKMHIFKYSPRRGTVAEKMKDQVSSEIKDERSKVLLEMSDENEKDYQKSYLGKTVKVLFEEKDGDFYKGHTSNYIMVKAKSKDDLSGKILDVKLESLDEPNLTIIGNI
jgi:threonylcarbamoyladenosine tRNA methylthiotransferase MtaB